MGRKEERFNAYSETVLKKTMDLIMSRLKELIAIRHLHNMFVQGEIAAYKDCLKKCAMWEGAEQYLGWDKE